jgi:hypothetical protein
MIGVSSSRRPRREKKLAGVSIWPGVVRRHLKKASGRTWSGPANELL